MAEVKNYGLSGVHRTLQLGKQGPVLVGDSSTDTVSVTMQDASTLTTMSGANATTGTHFITKSQLDSVYTEATFLANVNYDDTSPILLGNISSGTKTIITTFEVTTAFDANAIVTVGDSGNNSLLLSDSYAEVEVTGTYQTINTVEFASNSTLNIYVTQGGATQGAGTVLVSVVDGPVVNSGTINYGGAGGIALTDLSVSSNSPSGNGSLTYNSSTGVFTFTPADASLSNYSDTDVVSLLNNFGSNSISTTGNITAANLTGNITITGNVTGTSANVELVAGSYTTTFDNAGTATFPGDIIAGGGSVINKASGFVAAGTFVTLDNIKAALTTSGDRGLSLATVSGSITVNISATYGGSGGPGGGVANNLTYTTTPSTSIFNWNFGYEGEASTYIISDITNGLAYRITLQIGPSFNNNMISIERLV